MKRGFTLAELLIALAILGVIATFTIPKVLQSQQDSRFKAFAKETAATISAAYQAYKLKTAPTASTKSIDLVAYMNYVKFDTSTTIDGQQGEWGWACDNTYPCILLHNGGMLHINDDAFNGTGSTNAIAFQFDPDGKYSNNTTGPGKSVQFMLYYNGMLRTMGTLFPNTVNSTSPDIDPDPTKDPPWFGWD
jgi:prepilin-type N-terminal cleavage/methylation domain-containing protein